MNSLDKLIKTKRTVSTLPSSSPSLLWKTYTRGESSNRLINHQEIMINPIEDLELIEIDQHDFIVNFFYDHVYQIKIVFYNTSQLRSNQTRIVCKQTRIVSQSLCQNLLASIDHV